MSMRSMHPSRITWHWSTHDREQLISLISVAYITETYNRQSDQTVSNEKALI